LELLAVWSLPTKMKVDWAEKYASDRDLKGRIAGVRAKSRPGSTTKTPAIQKVLNYVFGEFEKRKLL
jgi:hypothetical protein